MHPFAGIAHIGVVVDDIEAAMARMSTTGTTWSSVLTWDTTVRRADGTLEQRPVRFVTSQQGPAHLKMIESAPGSIWAPTDSGEQMHHLTYWVEDIEVATKQVSGTFEVEADGLEPDGSTRFRYLTNRTGLRIELGLQANKAAFDRWAAGGSHQ
jgi:hypothetical protein